MARADRDVETELAKRTSAGEGVESHQPSSFDSDDEPGRRRQGEGDGEEDAETPVVDAATRESWLAAFRAVAKRRGGAIRPGQLGDALRLAGLVVTEAEVAQYRAEADPNDDGSISAEAFLALAGKARREVGVGAGDFETLRAALAVFDRQLSGRISAGDLRHWLTSLGEPIEEADVAKMLEHLVDEQGLLDYAELAHRLAGL